MSLLLMLNISKSLDCIFEPFLSVPACMIFIAITYFLLACWLVVFGCCIIMTIFCSIYWGVCNTDEVQWGRDGGYIDFYQFHFMFPKGKFELVPNIYNSDRFFSALGTEKDFMEVQGSTETKLFCKDFVEHAIIMYCLATISCFIVLLSLVHFLMALAANYAHIRGHDKFTELQDLHDLTSETLTLTERASRY